MRLADYVVQTLVDHDITECFLVAGGASMHLCDAFANHYGIRVTCCATENGCVTAAESYFRLTGKLAVVCVTAGPGALNCVNAVHGAYVDSMGLIVLSGQCDSRTINRDECCRQLGDQEADIYSMVENVTKSANEISLPRNIYWALLCAIHTARSGRPGPVWLSIPVDIQNKEYDTTETRYFSFTKPTYPDTDYEAIRGKLAEAKRPVVIAGSGIQTAGAAILFQELVNLLRIPVVTAFNGHDLLPSDHQYYVGRQGTIGDIAGNLAVQEADLLLILGSRMNPRSIGFDFEAFSPNSFKIMVDIDRAEFWKPFLKIDMGIHADLRVFLDEFLEFTLIKHDGFWRKSLAQMEWTDQCKHRQAEFPVFVNNNSSESRDPYNFITRLFGQLRDDDIIVTGNGSAVVCAFQAAKIKEGMRLYSNGGSASMGWALGAAIGAARGARSGQRVICIDGDGSLTMGSPELATINRYNLPIKIFILNNGGYSSIKQTFKRAFPNRPHIGYNHFSGVGLPNFHLLAEAYGLPYRRIDPCSVDYGLNSNELPSVTEVMIDPDMEFCPRIKFPVIVGA